MKKNPYRHRDHEILNKETEKLTGNCSEKGTKKWFELQVGKLLPNKLKEKYEE